MTERPVRWMARTAGLAPLVALATLALGSSPALAGPWWSLSARAAPTNLSAGQPGLVDVAAEDIGDEGVVATNHEVTITDTLPEGLAVGDPNAILLHLARGGDQGTEAERVHWSCDVAQQREVTCRTNLSIPAFESYEVQIPVEVLEPAGTNVVLVDAASVTGGESKAGGAVPAASVSRSLKISETPVVFGLEEGGYSITAEEEEGGVVKQAGAHPFQLTSTVDFDQVLEEVQPLGAPTLLEPGAAPGVARDLRFELPPGLLGNVTAAGQCTQLQFTVVRQESNGCPAASAIGVATVTVLERSKLGYVVKAVPLFNLEPAEGEPARFGFEANRVPVILNTAVRTDGDYGVTVDVERATEAAQVLGATVTFWGDPSSATHDQSRGWACLREGLESSAGETCQPPSSRSEVAFLTLPTSCEGRSSTAMSGDTWPIAGPTGPEETFETAMTAPLETLEGCGALPFSPSLSADLEQPAEGVQPGKPVTAASTPTGMNVELGIDQEATLDSSASGGDADLRSARVMLPQGVELSPSAANGLQACSEAQIGYQAPQGATDPLASKDPEPMHFSSLPVSCPLASEIGTVTVKTPLLAEELSGAVYLAEQSANPFGSLFAIYIVAENQKRGLRVKLAGEAKVSEATGQIETLFEEAPQVPFERLTVALFGGARASLTSPPTCGNHYAEAELTPWSTDDALPPIGAAPFTIDEGANGAPCPSGLLGFSPSFAAGASDTQAGSFTSFTVDITRPDGDQALTGVSVHLAPGIAALLANVTPCTEPPRGVEWACGEGSLIGHSIAWAGLGDEPYRLPGSVYLTTGYDGAPFGILVRTRAAAGPFDLGFVNVRSRINVNPTDASVTITTDPGPHGDALPVRLKGVPAQLKALEVTVDRPNFEFNPTSCDPMTIAGNLSADEGAVVPVSSRFQVGGCESLAFAPALRAATAGQASRPNGTSLNVKITSAGLGQADIAKVDLRLPSQLPTRQSTIKLACAEAVFDANPASCDEGSVIGSAVVHTPVLKSPLAGPAYLVSHGNAKFPDVEFVLQGEGITLVLDGSTDIKDGYTYSNFESAPDAPFTSFETTLPAGPHSALGVYVPESQDYNVCNTKLLMPTRIVSQTGKVIERETQIKPTGCVGVLGTKTSKPTAAQKLAKALESCRKKHEHSAKKRRACERQARAASRATTRAVARRARAATRARAAAPQ